MRSQRRWWAWCGFLLVLLTLGGCGEGDDDAEDGTVPLNPTTPAAVNLQGAFRGTWTSNVFAGGTGTVLAELVQAPGGSTVTGTIQFSNSPCGNRGNVTGTISGVQLDATADYGGGVRAGLLGTVSNDARAVTGTYAVNQNAAQCSGDRGSFTVVRQ